MNETMPKPLCSIAVITYNQERFIEDCLESIKSQDYPNLEVVLYDDASTDATFDMLSKWAKNNTNVKNRVLKNNRNRGISFTHNAALRACSGEIIKYIGGDDILYPDAIKKAVDFFSQNKSAACVMSSISYFSTIDDIRDNMTVERIDPAYKHFFSLDAHGQYLELIKRNCISAPGMFFRKTALEAVGFIDPNFTKFEDYHTWIKLTQTGYRFYYVPEPLVYWRRHKESVSYSVWNVSNAEYKRNELDVFLRYVLPDFWNLPVFIKMHVVSHILYLRTLLLLGVTRNRHKFAAVWKLIDPFWIKALPRKISKSIHRLLK